MPRELQHSSSKIRVLGNTLDVFLKPKKGNAQRPIFKPRWDFTVLVFRPIPYYDRVTKSWSPMLVSEHSGEYGEWYGNGFVIGVVNCGRKVARCILVHRSESIDVLQNSPINAVAEYLNSYKRIKLLLADGRKAEAQAQLKMLNSKIWNIYSVDTATSVEVRQAAFLQCPVLAVASRPYERLLGTSENDPLPLVLLIGSAMTAFEEAVKSDDPGSEMAVKDVINFKDGHFVEIGRKGYDKSQWFPTTGVPSENYYTARTFAKYSKFEANLVNHAKVLANKIEPWDDMFQLPDADEQVGMMIWAGISPVYLYAALVDVFKLPDSIIRRARQMLGETSVSFPAKSVDIPESRGPAVVEEQVEEEEGGAEVVPDDSDEVTDVLPPFTTVDEDVPQEVEENTEIPSPEDILGQQMIGAEDDDTSPTALPDVPIASKFSNLQHPKPVSGASDQVRKNIRSAVSKLRSKMSE